jgi:3-polyprenyl-4-hydroxybenzoate decarboxylase
VVDHDVDIGSDIEVLHAIATRVRTDTDAFMLPYAKGSPFDPASYDPAGSSNLGTRMAIDATRKANYPDEISVPGFLSIGMEASLRTSRFLTSCVNQFAVDRYGRGFRYALQVDMAHQLMHCDNFSTRRKRVRMI